MLWRSCNPSTKTEIWKRSSRGSCRGCPRAERHPSASCGGNGGHVRFGSKADILERLRDVSFTPESGHCRATVGCLFCAKSGHRISRNHGNTLIRTTDYPCRAVLFCLALNSSPANWLAKPHPLASPNFFDCHDPADQPILNARRPGAQTPERHLKPIALERPVRSVPTSASTGAPVCAPASGVVITVTGCTRRCSAVVRTPMYSAIDTSDAPRCQRPPNSSVRSINWQRRRFRRWPMKREWCCAKEHSGGNYPKATQLFHTCYSFTTTLWHWK